VQLKVDLRTRSLQGTLRYNFADCSFGRYIVAWLDGSVCYLAFGNSNAALLAELKARFPAANLIEEPGGPLTDRVAESVENPCLAQDIPVALLGTAFQKLVWAALRQIKPGATATYAEIAAVIGHPTAARAVAQACGANPVAILVPCHRVIGSDGSLRGYRWGVDLKRLLLERERS